MNAGRERARITPPDRGIVRARNAVLAGMALVIAARLLRPLPETAGPALILVVGSLPNFGAGLGLPFVFAAIPRVLPQARPAAGRPPFGLFCIGAFAALVLWEYAQLACWGMRVDPCDLAASGLGAALAASIGFPRGGGAE